MDARDQRAIDRALIELDGTANKAKLGANALLAASLACARAGAADAGLPLFEHLGHLAGNHRFTLPVPMFNLINGGVHAGNGLQVQEFLLLPVGTSSFSEAVRCGAEVYAELRRLLERKHGRAAANVGDEGGFAPPLRRTREALDLLARAVESSGHSKVARLGLDCAASQFGAKGLYRFEGRRLKGHQLGERYEELVRHYDLLSLEDPFEQEDWKAWESFAWHYPGVQVVGDDLLVTSPERVREAVRRRACNALLLKVNQVGTISEAIEAHRIAAQAGWKTVVSHRSGETEDAFIADLAVGLGAGQCKFGAPARGERTAKYNQLLRLEERLGPARYPRFARPFA
jgi:enolase